MRKHLIFTTALLLGGPECLMAMPLDRAAIDVPSGAIVRVQATLGRPTGGTTSGVPGNGGPLGGGINGVSNGTQVGGGAPSSINPAGANGNVNTQGQSTLRPNGAGATQPNGSKPSRMMPNGVQKID